MAKKTHKDVEYAVARDDRHEEEIFKNPTEALAAAAQIAMMTGASVLDVLIFSEAGARFHGGDDAVERFREDPEASVFERFTFKANAVGRVA